MKSQEESIIFINPVHRVSVQGRDKQVYHTVDHKTGEVIPTQGMNKTKETGVAEQFSFPYNVEKGRLETGLDVNVTNPFNGMDVSDVMSSYSLDSEWSDILEKLVKQENIKKQTYFEILAGVSPEFYDNSVKYSVFNFPRNMTNAPEPNFLERFKIILYDRPNRFTDTTPRGRLAIQLAKVHPKIANNSNETNPAVHRFYISEEHEAEKKKNARKRLVQKAIYHLVNLREEETDFVNYQFASILTDNSNKPLVVGEVSPETVEAQLNDFLSEGNSHLADNVNKFQKLVNLRKTKDGLAKFDIRYMIQQAINSNIISARDGYYIWHSQKENSNVYKFNSYDKLVSMLFKEYKTYNPDDDSVTNWFGELKDELKSKGIKLS